MRIAKAPAVFGLLASIALGVSCKNEREQITQPEQQPVLKVDQLSGSALTAKIDEIFARVRRPLLRREGQTVTNLSVSPIGGDEIPDDIYRKFRVYADRPLVWMLPVGEGQGVAVEVAPIHCLSCGCCCDNPIVDFHDLDFAFLAQVPDIRWLRIHRTQVTELGFRALQHQQRLVLLDARHNGLTDDVLNSIGQLKSLKYLDLADNRLSGRALGELSALSQLETLVLSGDLAADALAYLPPLPSLRKLIITHHTLTGKGAEQLARLPALEELVLSHGPISGAALAALPRLASLKKLDLRDTRVDDNAIPAIAAQPLLESLVLTNSQVTGVGIRELRKTATLRQLSLSGGDIDDDDAEPLGTPADAGTQIEGFIPHSGQPGRPSPRRLEEP